MTKKGIRPKLPLSQRGSQCSEAQAYEPTHGNLVCVLHIGLTQLNIDTAMDKPLTSARRNRVLLTLWTSRFWKFYVLQTQAH